MKICSHLDFAGLIPFEKLHLTCSFAKAVLFFATFTGMRTSLVKIGDINRCWNFLTETSYQKNTERAHEPVK